MQGRRERASFAAALLRGSCHLILRFQPRMRLDVFLKQSRLVPRRTLAQEMCEAGAVKINGSRAKSAHEVRVADILSIRHRGRITTVRVVKIPPKPPSKQEAQSLYETISVESYVIE